MKKLISLIMASLLLTGVFTGCGNKNDTNPETGSDKLNVVTTIFPEYDWVREIAGDRADVTMLLDNGVDLHSYNPTADDVVKISTCDMFIYVGGESDEWVEDALKESANPDMAVVNLLEVLGDSVKEEEVKEGMEAEEHEHEEGEEEHEEGEDEHEEGPEYDEHVWLSLKNAAVLCRYIADKLGEIDSANSSEYSANADAYIEKLNALDAKYEEAVNAAQVKTLLFGDRFPFRYMTDDYGLDYFAAFVGCSAEAEASFETIAFLANKVDELGLKSVMTIEGSDGTIARTIVETSQSKDAGILTMDSMQSTTSQDVADGVTYLSVMEKNLDTLKQALK
jgi:zinc transport system substrate-binding protein